MVYPLNDNFSRRLVPVVCGFLFLFRLSNSICQINSQHSSTNVRPLIAITNLHIASPPCKETEKNSKKLSQPEMIVRAKIITSFN